MAIGQCGSVLGSHLFPSKEGPRYMWVTHPPSLYLSADHDRVCAAKGSLSLVRSSSLELFVRSFST